MLLDKTTRSLAIQLGEITVSSEVSVVSNVAIVTKEQTYQQTLVSKQTLAAKTTLIPAPAANTAVLVEEILINNTDTVTHNVIVTLETETGTYRSLIIALLAGQGYQYTKERGWTPITATAETTSPIVEILGQGPYLVMATGQSEMVGHNTGGTFKVTPGVKIWNIGNQAWETCDIQHVTYAQNLAAGSTVGGGNNNIAVAFCHRLHEETGQTVYLYINAMDGASITNWAANTPGAFRTNFLAEYANTIAAANGPGKTIADLMLWLQGEADAGSGMSYADYETYWQQWLAGMQGSGRITVNTPIITAPINRDYIHFSSLAKTDVQEFLANLGNSYIGVNGRTGASASAGLHAGADQRHYDGPSMWELGYNRFFNTLLKIDNQGDKAPNPLFNFMDSGSYVPTVGGETTFGTQTYSIQDGEWSRIGDLIFFQSRIQLTAVDATRAGTTIIKLPFICEPIVGARNTNFPLTLAFVGGCTFSAGYSQFTAFTNPGTPNVRIYQTGSNVPPIALASTAFSASAAFMLSGWFRKSPP